MCISKTNYCKLSNGKSPLWDLYILAYILVWNWQFWSCCMLHEARMSFVPWILSYLYWFWFNFVIDIDGSWKLKFQLWGQEWKLLKQSMLKLCSHLLEFNLSNRVTFSTVVNGFVSCFRFPNLQFEYKDPEAGFNRSKVSFCSKLIESCVLKASMVQCWSIPLINAQSTLDQCSINTLVMVDTQSTSRLTVADTPSSVDRVSIKMLRVPVKGIDWHSIVDVFSTHDPSDLHNKTNVHVQCQRHFCYVLYMQRSANKKIHV